MTASPTLKPLLGLLLAIVPAQARAALSSATDANPAISAAEPNPHDCPAFCCRLPSAISQPAAELILPELPSGQPEEPATGQSGTEAQLAVPASGVKLKEPLIVLPAPSRPLAVEGALVGQSEAGAVKAVSSSRRRNLAWAFGGAGLTLLGVSVALSVSKGLLNKQPYLCAKDDLLYECQVDVSTAETIGYTTALTAGTIGILLATLGE